MTNEEAIAAINVDQAEADTVRAAVGQSHTDLLNAMSDLDLVVNTLESRLQAMEETVQYAIDNYLSGGA